jgi:hypothetical protein
LDEAVLKIDELEKLERLVVNTSADITTPLVTLAVKYLKKDTHDSEEKVITM